ncbi:metallophosphoesterase family protein [Thomasclavelia cocleata]|uniref:metallophosphoesterase family protein n=1 Tax=Thomasclavelia cocleata TaxID=69824 RepID=UPI00256F10ED|nr:metallophosphoesterase family protein [Thomasclavelia cocleata]
MDYVTGDIHGCFDKFMKLLKKIKFSEKDNLYIIGDVIDRGPKPIETLQYIMKQPNIYMTLGNHEDMMLIYLNEPDDFNKRIWFQNGGNITYDSFIELNEIDRKEIVKYLSELPLYFIKNKKILVHAGIEPLKIDTTKSIEENMKLQTKDDLVWIRDEFIFSKTNLSSHIVIFGHTPVIHINGRIPMKIWHDKDKIGIDCGAVFSFYDGKLACIRLDDMKEFYI